jgi:hypothetical protein
MHLRGFDVTPAIRCARAVVMLALGATLLAPADASATERCSEPSVPGDFVCGALILVVDRGTAVDDVVAACEPRARSVTAAGSDAAAGTPIYRLAVETGSETRLQDCYLAQRGVLAAELVGFGELTPDTSTAVDDSRLPEIGLTLSALAAAVAVRAVRIRALTNGSALR